LRQARKISVSDKKKITLKKRRKRRRRLALVVSIIVLLMALIAGGFYYLISTFLTINEIKVTGKSVYTIDEIIEASGMEIGRNMVTFSAISMANNLTKKLPYIEKAIVKRKLPKMLWIEVMPATPEAVIHSNGVSYIVSSKFKVLELIEDENTYNLPEVYCSYETDPKEGELIPFSDEINKKLHMELFEALRKEELLSKLNSADISNIYDIKLKLDNRIDVQLGDYFEIEDKVKFAKGIMDRLSDKETGTINATDTKKGSFVPRRAG